MVNLPQKLQEKIDKLMLFFEYLKKVRDPWEGDWQEECDYMLPRMADFSFEQKDQRERRGKKIYDSTALHSVQTVTDGLQGYMAPESSPWYRMSLPFENNTTTPWLRQFVQDTEDAMYGELRRSTFYHALSEALPISIVLGTTTIYQEEDQLSPRIIFKAMSPKEMYLHENKQGHVDIHVRRFFMSADNLVDSYQEKVPDEIREKAKENPFEDHLVLHFKLPRRYRNPYKLDYRNKRYASYHVLEEEKILLRESGYDDDPYTTHQWYKNSDEVYGRGWGETAMPPTLRLQQIARTLLLGAHRATNPPIRYPAELTGDLNLEPGGMNPYFDPARPIERVDMLGKYPITRDQEEDLRQQIREIMMVDFFIALAQLKGQKTATEVLELRGEQAAILSTLTNRLYTELLTPLLIKTWRMAYRAGRMPRIPEELIAMGVHGLKIEFIGPLAQIQKRYHAMQGVTQTMAQIMPFFDPAMFPESKDVVDGTELVRHVLHESNFPQPAIRDTRAVKQIRETRARKLAMQERMENLEKLGKALPGLRKGQEPKPGTPLIERAPAGPAGVGV